MTFRVNRDQLNGGIALLIAGFVLVQAAPLIFPVRTEIVNQQVCYQGTCAQVPTPTDVNATARNIFTIVFNAFELIGIILIGYAFIVPNLPIGGTSLKPSDTHALTETSGFCGHCGKTMQPNLKFCPSCGKPNALLD